MQLPESEFAIMNYIWSAEPPVTTAMVMEAVGNERAWKPQTCLTLVARLIERGFLEARKGKGREKTFSPLISRREYLQMETSTFMKQVHGKSLSSLLASLTGMQLSDKDKTELRQWFDKLTEE